MDVRVKSSKNRMEVYVEGQKVATAQHWSGFWQLYGLDYVFMWRYGHMIHEVHTRKKAEQELSALANIRVKQKEMYATQNARCKT